MSNPTNNNNNNNNNDTNNGKPLLVTASNTKSASSVPSMTATGTGGAASTPPVIGNGARTHMNNNNNINSSNTATDDQQQQAILGRPEVQQHKLVNRLLREITAKVHHASSGKLSAEEVSSIEAASKKANRALRDAGGMSFPTISESREGRSHEGGGATSSRRSLASTGTTFLTGERSPSAKVLRSRGSGDKNKSGNRVTDESQESQGSGANKKTNNSNQKDDDDDDSASNSKKKNKEPKKLDSTNSYLMNDGKRRVYAKSIFSSLPRATNIPEGFFKKHQLLGSGAFAQTYLCEWVSEKEDQEQEELMQQQQQQQRKNHRTLQGTPGGNMAGGGRRTPQRVHLTPRADTAESRLSATSGSVHTGGRSAREVSSATGGGGSSVHNNNNNNKNDSSVQQQQPAQPEYSERQLASPYGQFSHLSSTKAFVNSTVDNSQIARDRAFVCKFEAGTTASKRLECMGNIANKNIAEEHILANCAHPNIVAFVDQFQDSENNNVLVMEYVDGGDLKHELDRRSERVNSYGEAVAAKHFSERSILFLFVQMVMAIEYLHRHNILHRDLKTPNILLSKKWLVKISDFGLAKQFDVDVDMNVSVSNVGTPYYLSPESFRRKPYSDKADIWCLGVILYELITLQKPFDGETLKDLARAVCLDPPVPFNRSTISSDLKDLCLSMLSKSSKDRPTAKEILRLPIMEGAMADFLEKFAIATSSSTSSVDVSWNRLLQEQRKLIKNDDMSSTKSRREMSRDRSSQRHSAYSANLYSQNRGGASSHFSEDDEKNRRDDDDDDGDDDEALEENAGVA